MSGPWGFLIMAGVLEIGFTTLLKLSDNFTRPLYVTGFLICVGLSFYCLNRSLVAIPLGTAYAVWTGIGAFGTALVGILVYKDPATFMRLLFLILLIGSIVGLKLVSR